MLGHVGDGGGVTSGAMFGENIVPFHAVRAVTVAKRREYMSPLWNSKLAHAFTRPKRSKVAAFGQAVRSRSDQSLIGTCPIHANEAMSS